MPEKIIILTGERYGGKTTKLKSLIADYRGQGVWPAGIITINPEGESGPGKGPGFPDKSRYFAQDITTGESRLLASEKPTLGADMICFKRFYFSKETFAWASSVIEKGFTAPVLVMDELGALELQGKGFWPITEKMLDVYGGTLIISVRKQFLSKFLGKSCIKSCFFEVMETVC